MSLSHRPAATLAIVALLAGIVGAGCGVLRPPPSAGPTQDPGLAAALTSACAGHGVPGAGRVSAGPNHLVALDYAGRELQWQHFDDESGAPGGWSWSLPPSWLPADLADVEVVACIQPDQATIQWETCAYAGGAHTISRFESSRQVIAVEAATGSVLAVLALTDRANECDVLAKSTTTALHGDVMPEQVWSALASLVETGRFETACEVLCAGDSVRAELGPWGFEAAAVALDLDGKVLATEIATMDPKAEPGASLQAMAESRGLAWADVHREVLAGARARMDERIAAGTMTADVEAFTLSRLEAWLNGGGRPAAGGS